MDLMMTDFLQTQLVLYKYMYICTQIYHIPLLKKVVSEWPWSVGGAMQMSVLTKLPLKGKSLSYYDILTLQCVYKVNQNLCIFLPKKV